jgi:hypothetical protein
MATKRVYEAGDRAGRIVEDEGTDASVISTGAKTNADVYLAAFPPTGENPTGAPNVLRVIKRANDGESVDIGAVCRAFAAMPDYAAHLANSHGPRAWSLHFCWAGPPA